MDGLGCSLVPELTGGQAHDGVMLQKCLEQLDISGSTVLADKACGSWEKREYIANHDADFCVPPKSNSVDPWYTDFSHYKRSWDGHYLTPDQVYGSSCCGLDLGSRATRRFA